MDSQIFLLFIKFIYQILKKLNIFINHIYIAYFKEVSYLFIGRESIKPRKYTMIILERNSDLTLSLYNLCEWKMKYFMQFAESTQMQPSLYYWKIMTLRNLKIKADYKLWTSFMGHKEKNIFPQTTYIFNLSTWIDVTNLITNSSVLLLAWQELRLQYPALLGFWYCQEANFVKHFREIVFI